MQVLSIGSGDIPWNVRLGLPNSLVLRPSSCMALWNALRNKRWDTKEKMTNLKIYHGLTLPVVLYSVVVVLGFVTASEFLSVIVYQDVYLRL